MFAALAHRVVVLPSTALAGWQQPPDDEATTGFPCDSNVSAAEAGAAAKVAATSAAVTAARSLVLGTARTFHLGPSMARRRDENVYTSESMYERGRGSSTGLAMTLANCLR